VDIGENDILMMFSYGIKIYF